MFLKEKSLIGCCLLGIEGTVNGFSCRLLYLYSSCTYTGWRRSGNIDGLARHAIGKFSHIHFAANDDAKKRLLAMGEEKFRIFNVGAPQIDEIKNKEVSKTEEIKKI